MEDYVVCPICGVFKKNLTKHIQMKHHLDKNKILQLYPGIKLIANSTSQKISNALKENWKNEDYAEKCSSYWKSELHKERKSIDMKNQWKNEEWKLHTINCMKNINENQRKARSISLSNTLNDLWQNDSFYQERRREAGRLQMAKNMQDPTWNHPKRYLYNGVYFRSKLEVDFAKKFDELNMPYEYETVKLIYSDDEGIQRTYYVDFYFPDYNLLVEIKPEVFLGELLHGKLEVATNSSYNYIILTEKDLPLNKLKAKLSILS